MLPTYITTLCSARIPGIAAGSPGAVVLAKVDARVDHTHSVGGHPFLGDHDLFDRLTQGDHRGGVAKNGFLQLSSTFRKIRPRPSESRATSSPRSEWIS